MKAVNAFQSLKVALSSSLVLWNPDFHLPFLVQTDTYETSLGAILSQEFDGEEDLVIYISHKLKPTGQSSKKLWGRWTNASLSVSLSMVLSLADSP